MELYVKFGWNWLLGLEKKIRIRKMNNDSQDKDRQKTNFKTLISIV